MDEKEKTIVIDNGSGNFKIGFSGEPSPKSVFPSISGRPKIYHSFPHSDPTEYGDEALYHRYVLTFNEIIHRGIITNWKDYDGLINYGFINGLRVPIEENSIIFTETTFNPRDCREKLIELMIEVKNSRLFYIKNDAVLSLLASGRKTGIVIETGDGCTCIVPIYEGLPIRDAIKKIDIGGSDIVKNFIESVSSGNKEILKKSWEYVECCKIKEKLFYVADDYEAELEKVKSTNEKVHMIHKYNKVEFLDRERFMNSEILFDPKMLDLDFEGIPKEIVKSILKCDVKIQRNLFSNIIISGGNSLLNGFVERIKKELNILTKNMNININVVAQDGRENWSWVGGSILSSEDNFNEIAISSSEYMEVGKNIVNIKCKQ